MTLSVNVDPSDGELILPNRLTDLTEDIEFGNTESNGKREYRMVTRWTVTANVYKPRSVTANGDLGQFDSASATNTMLAGTQLTGKLGANSSLYGKVTPVFRSLSIDGPFGGESYVLAVTYESYSAWQIYPFDGPGVGS